MSQIRILDTTLRDSEQSPGIDASIRAYAVRRARYLAPQ